MNALCLVAHPDDCVIFAYSYIYNHPQHDWSVAYLTYQLTDARGQEISSFWRRRGIKTYFLGFEDHWHDNEQQRFTRWDPDQAKAACRSLADQFHLVLTHAADGDYGHIHHRLVHESVAEHPGLITFASPDQGTTYILPQGAYDLNELPLHREIIQGFHSGAHRNSYKEHR